MERVMVIGCCGSGKTTLSRRLGEKLGLPVVHLDRIFWSPGHWEHLSREEFDQQLLEEAAKDRWVMDGNYNRTLDLRLERADGVVYLDFTRWRCLWGWMGRVIQNWGKARPDMAEGCAEWFDPEMAAFIWKFNPTNRKRYLEMLHNWQGGKVYILRTRRDVKRFLKQDFM